MEKTTIEQSAKRLFDAYIRHVNNSNLEELRNIFHEAYSFHEKFRFLPGKRKGLHNIDEFQLLKALRNYSVHTGEFFGEVYTYDLSKVTPQLMIYHINLHRLCLVRKSEVKRAINSEKPLQDSVQEQAKISAINSQLIPYGDYYDLEPVVFNFIAKLYEELLPLDLSIPGEAYATIQHSYDDEARYGMSHYVPVIPIPFDSEVLMENLVPLDSGVYEGRDEFDDIATSGLIYSNYKLTQTVWPPGFEYLAEADKTMAMDLIGRDPDSVELAACTPHHIGLAVILDDGMKDIDVKPFNIKQELAGLRQHAIQIDEKFLPTHDEEVFVLVCVSGKENRITPSLINKDLLITYYEEVRPDLQYKTENQKQKPRIEGSSSAKNKHKNAKKRKRKAAAKARKRQRK